MRTVSYRDITIGGLLTALSVDYPENEALVYPDRGIRYDFRRLESLAKQAATGLASLGVKKGDRIALWAPNIPEWVVLQFGLAKIGAILVTVNTALTRSEVEYLLKQSESCALILSAGFRGLDYVQTVFQILPELKEAGSGEFHSPNLPFLRHVIHIGDNCPPEMLPYDDLMSRGSESADDRLAELATGQHIDDVINMQYTSGTTGFPKGVMLTHRNILNNGFWLGEGLGLTEADRVCVPVPFFHCFGCVIGILGAYTHASAVLPVESFDALQVLRLVEQERCTALYGVPTMFISELEQLQSNSFDLSSLRTGVMAGSLCPEQLMRQVIDKMTLTELTIAYGLTECSPGITQTPRHDSVELRTQTVGVVMPEMEAKIVDPVTGEVCAAGEPGELCCRGYNVMKGYYNNPQATEEALDGEGWLHTGDQASIDSDGYVRITGRIKDLIIRGGENIAPKEIEDVLRTHQDISDVYVYGIPDARLGEAVAAAIKLNPGAEAAAERFIEYCRGRIARFKIPTSIRFVETFPMTASGKIQKYKLRETHSE